MHKYCLIRCFNQILFIGVLRQNILVVWQHQIWNENVFLNHVEWKLQGCNIVLGKVVWCYKCASCPFLSKYNFVSSNIIPTFIHSLDCIINVIQLVIRKVTFNMYIYVLRPNVLGAVNLSWTICVNVDVWVFKPLWPNLNWCEGYTRLHGMSLIGEILYSAFVPYMGWNNWVN